jgi:ornithine carbamoyltransferase
LIIIRTIAHDIVETIAKYSTIPVINGLTDFSHPCQVLADMQTFFEHRGEIKGKTVAWIGDGNNMCNSYIEAAHLFDFTLRVCSPEEFAPDASLIADSPARIELVQDPLAAAEGAHLLVTDVWASMGQEQEQKRRQQAFANYQINAKTMSVAAPDAVFMHCLPAHRGEEVTAEVIDGAQSIVWDEAENRLHAQKALMEFLLCGELAD